MPTARCIPDPAASRRITQWLVTARTEQGRFAYLGFSNVWYGNWYDAEYKATKVYTITDRPVYRPGQTVHYKFWVRHAQYDMGDVSEFAARDFTVEIHNPKGENIVSVTKRTDAYGGIEGDYTVPADATLGVYALPTVNANRHTAAAASASRSTRSPSSRSRSTPRPSR